VHLVVFPAYKTNAAALFRHPLLWLEAHAPAGLLSQRCNAYHHSFRRPVVQTVFELRLSPSPFPMGPSHQLGRSPFSFFTSTFTLSYHQKGMYAVTMRDARRDVMRIGLHSMSPLSPALERQSIHRVNRVEQHIDCHSVGRGIAYNRSVSDRSLDGQRTRHVFPGSRRLNCMLWQDRNGGRDVEECTRRKSGMSHLCVYSRLSFYLKFEICLLLVGCKFQAHFLGFRAFRF